MMQELDYQSGEQNDRAPSWLLRRILLFPLISFSCMFVSYSIAMWGNGKLAMVVFCCFTFLSAIVGFVTAVVGLIRLPNQKVRRAIAIAFDILFGFLSLPCLLHNLFPSLGV